MSSENGSLSYNKPLATERPPQDRMPTAQVDRDVLSFRGNAWEETRQGLMRVSVIVPTFNRRELVVRTVNTLLDQEFPVSRYEIIVVVDGSTDGTAEALSTLRPLCRFRVLEQEHRGLAAARNTGWHASENELVIFISDNLLCDPRLLRAHREAHKHTDDALGVGAIFLSDESPRTLAAECFNREAGAYALAHARNPEIPFPFSACHFGNTSIRRHWLMESTGFDERFRSQSDAELAARLVPMGAQPRYVPGAVARQVYTKSSAELLRDAEAFADADVLFMQEHPKLAALTVAGKIAREANWKRSLRRMATSVPHISNLVLAPFCSMGEAFPRQPKVRHLGIRALQTRRVIFYYRRVLDLQQSLSGSFHASWGSALTPGDKFGRERTNGSAYHLTEKEHAMTAEIREPAVAGRFYPEDGEQLTAVIASYVFRSREAKLPAIGCVVPHAGYMYSGRVAGALYERLELPKRYVILCPNHTGAGHPLAIMHAGAWRTPLGDVQIDRPLADSLLGLFPLLNVDAEAHRAEHGLEVQLPFLQTFAPDFKFVPIVIGTGRLDVLTALGESIAKAIETAGERVMVIASSDMNHYESDSETRAKDRLAINRLLALDAPGLHEVVHQQNISMCGYGPAVAMLTAARRLGASRAELVKYATSGDVSGDRDRVVGYAGIAVL